MKPRKSPKAVIFDWNGTFHDMSVMLAQDKHVARVEFGLALTDDEVRAHWGQPAQSFFRNLFRQPNTPWQELDAIFRSYDDQFPRKLLPHVVKTLKILRRAGIGRGVVTGTSRQYLYPYMDQAGLPREHLDFVHAKEDTADDIAAGRPALSKAVRFFAQQGIAGREIVVVGDEVSNMQEAAAVQVGFIAVASGTRSREELIQGGIPPQQIIAGLHELPAALGIQPGSASY